MATEAAAGCRNGPASSRHLAAEASVKRRLAVQVEAEQVAFGAFADLDTFKAYALVRVARYQLEGRDATLGYAAANFEHLNLAEILAGDQQLVAATLTLINRFVERLSEHLARKEQPLTTIRMPFRGLMNDVTVLADAQRFAD